MGTGLPSELTVCCHPSTTRDDSDGDCSQGTFITFIHYVGVAATHERAAAGLRGVKKGKKSMVQ